MRRSHLCFYYIAIAKIKQDLTWTHTLDSNRANPFLVKVLAFLVQVYGESSVLRVGEQDTPLFGTLDPEIL